MPTWHDALCRDAKELASVSTSKKMLVFISRFCDTWIENILVKRNNMDLKLYSVL